MATVRFAESLPDRAAAVGLRKDIHELQMARFGRDWAEEADPEMDGRTLCAFQDTRIVGSVDVHWGGDEPLPHERTTALRVRDLTGTAEDELIVVLDAMVVHPDHAEKPIELEMLEAAGAFAASVGARWVFTSAEPGHIRPHAALGFQTHGAPGMEPGIGPYVTLVLDLADHEHLESVRSPFRSAARKAAIKRAGDAPKPVWRQIYQRLQEARQRDAALLEHLRDSELAKLLVGSRLAKPARGKRILAKGSRGSDLYMVLSGAVEVRHDERSVAVLGEGEVFGEVGLLLDVERTADVYAATDDVAVLRLDEASLTKLFESDPAMGGRLALGLAKALCWKLVNRTGPA